MQALEVQVKNGRLVLDEPTDLPDGAEIEVIVLDDSEAGRGMDAAEYLKQYRDRRDDHSAR